MHRVTRGGFSHIFQRSSVYTLRVRQHRFYAILYTLLNLFSTTVTQVTPTLRKDVVTSDASTPCQKISCGNWPIWLIPAEMPQRAGGPPSSNSVPKPASWSEFQTRTKKIKPHPSPKIPPVPPPSPWAMPQSETSTNAFPEAQKQNDFMHLQATNPRDPAA